MGDMTLDEVLYTLALFGVWMFVRVVYQYSTIKTQRVTIKYLKYGADAGSSQYMVYTKDGQVLRNTNLLFFAKFRSDELFAGLKVGKTYDIKTCGIRAPFLGWYKNIISVKEVKATKRRVVKKSK